MYVFWLNLRVLLPPILTMMHLYIMLYTCWTPLRPVVTLFSLKGNNAYGYFYVVLGKCSFESQHLVA